MSKRRCKEILFLAVRCDREENHDGPHKHGVTTWRTFAETKTRRSNDKRR